MKILVACEESQRVCNAFRRRGHEAYSCDLQEPSGGHPEWHIKSDCLPLLDGNCEFITMDGGRHKICGKWDLIVAHPPCTHLAASGARWFGAKRKDGRQEDAVRFFCRFLTAKCDRIAIENPVGIISGEYVRKRFPELSSAYDLPRRPTQIVQPYFFGDEAKKATCLWLKGLPKLVETKVVRPGEFYIAPDGRKYSISASADCARDENGKKLRWNDPATAVARSRTFLGIANAMAEQWG